LGQARPGVGGQLDHHRVEGTLWPITVPGPSGEVTAAPTGGGILAEVLVERVLVLQAAHQPAARAGDPQRVHRQLLVLGHPDRHRLEVLQERGAAQVTAARADPALQPRLVPRPIWRSSTRALSRPPRSRTSARKSTRCGALKYTTNTLSVR